MIELGVENELIVRRPTHMAKDYGCQQGSDVEMEDATPWSRDFQPNTDDPYETPVILKKVNRRGREILEDSGAESHATQVDTDGEDKKKMTSKSGRVCHR